MTIDEGFEHFDGNQRETFAAALILLCLDEDPDFRELLENLVRRSISAVEGSALRDWGREASLETESDRRRRCDLWLRFDAGSVLVEIKTHSGWDRASVLSQMADQLAASLNGNRVVGALLLAPGTLLRDLPGLPAPTLSWQEFLRAAFGIETPTRTLALAREHWSRTVERDFALSGPVAPFEQLATQTACLVAFLRSAFLRLGGEPKGDAVWFSSPDGQPSRRHGWAWIGMAVPGSLPDGSRGYIGIYTYTVAPPGQALGVFVEAYRLGRDDEPLASIPLPQASVSTDTLHAALEQFVASYGAANP
jgi:hypothetical protein